MPQILKSALFGLLKKSVYFRTIFLSLSSYDIERQIENQTTTIQPHFLHGEQGHRTVLHLMEESHCKIQKSCVRNCPLLMRQGFWLLPAWLQTRRPVQEPGYRAREKKPVWPKLSGKTVSYANSLLRLCRVSWKAERFSNEGVSLAKDADERDSRRGPDIWSWVTEGSMGCRAVPLLQGGVALISDSIRKLQTNDSQK